MAYPFDESFETGIPSGFAANGGNGGITATWNADAQAADLVFNSAQNFWRITAAPLSSDFWVEMDVEIVASSSPPPHFGFWLYDGIGTYEGHRLCVYNNNWAHSWWSSGGSEYEQGVVGSAAWAVIGARRTIRLEVRRDANVGVWFLRLWVDGLIIWHDFRRPYTSFQPAIFGYGITLRLHRFAGGTPSGLSVAPTPSHRGLPIVLGQRILIPEYAAMVGRNARGLLRLTGNRNHYYHGSHRIAGTVKHREKGVLADAPLRRRVLLIDERTQVVVRETWSDADTGAYSFEHIAVLPHYLVIAFDHEHQHRAVVADNLRAQPMTEASP